MKNLFNRETCTSHLYKKKKRKEKNESVLDEFTLYERKL